MNVQGAVDQAGRLIRQARDLISRDSNIEETSGSELWKKLSPQLDKALTFYDRKESPDTPESSWIPGQTTKKKCQLEIDEILDAILAVLGTCGAAGYRAKIRNLEADNAASQTRIAKNREQSLSAPSEESQNIIEGVLVPSREALRDSIADEADRITARDQQIEKLKNAFREHLQHIGITVSPETADSFLLPVEDDVVSMAAVISNIGLLTEQLQHLVDASKEAPAETKRYYGMHLLLVFAVDRIQTHYIQEIDQCYLPRIAQYEKEASEHISDAQRQIKAGGSREALEANNAANRRNIQACRLLADMLEGQRRSVLAENHEVKKQADLAVNTYRTVCLSFNITELIGYCDAAFNALRELRIPSLRPFQSAQLNNELQRLAERVAAGS